MPAGTGLSRRTLPRSHGRPRPLRLRRRQAPARRSSKRASPAPRPRPSRSSSPCSSTAAPTRSPCSSRPGIRSTPRSGPSSRSRPARASPSPRTRACAGTRRWRRSLSSTARARSPCSLPIGYTNADQSHFTSRHYWEVGATDPHLRTGWLGRYLDITGTSDNPLQGLALADSLHPALASVNVPIAAVSSIDDYDFWATNVWGEPETRMLDALGTVPALVRSRPREGRGGDVPGVAPARPASAFRRRQLGKHRRRTRRARPVPVAGLPASPP